jgi:hypothetical protein
VQKNIKMIIYYANVCKHKNEKNMTRLWCKIVLTIGVEYTEGNERSYFYVYAFEDLAQGSFQRGLYMCIE